MAEDDKSQEKTEEPTPRRLEKAREDGQVPRSKELTTTAILLCSAIGFLWFGGFFAEKIQGVIRYNFSIPREAIFDPAWMTRYLTQSFADALLGLAPFFLVLLLAAIIGPIALGGWLFSAKSLAPKLNRLNPLEGIKRMFSMKSLIELVKAIAKVVLMGVCTVAILHLLKGELLGLAYEPLSKAIKHSATMSLWVALVLSAVTILIVLIDVPFQLWEHTKKLKMSFQDIKDEMKETDGKPEVKSKIRQLQQAMANRRMMAEVPDADVVITNPTHYAIAVKYDPDSMATPIVVAKGIDQIALKIREVAGAHEVEIVESPRLARAIYYTTELDQEIPGGLYIAVAKVLAYVFQLRSFRRGTGQRPSYPYGIDVPSDMIFDE